MLKLIDAILLPVSGLLKQSMRDFCEIEVNSQKINALVTRDGSMVTVMKVAGINQMQGEAEFQQAINRLEALFSVFMSNPGHTMQIGFEYDREGVHYELDKITHRAIVTCRNMNIDAEEIMDERKRVLAPLCASETVDIAFWTHTSTLSKNELKRIKARRTKDNRKNNPPSMADAQSLVSEIEEIVDRHKSAVDSIADELSSMGVRTVKLNRHQMVKHLRMKADPEFTAENWQPILVGDKIPVRLGQKIRGERDMSDVGYPPIAAQIFPRDATRIDTRIVQMGNRIYMPMYIDIMPQNPQSFNQLFKRLINANIPYRINIQLGSEGMKSISERSLLVSFLTFASSKNKQLASAVKSLNDYILNNGTAVSIRIVMTTWVDGGTATDNMDKLKSQASSLVRAVENWGNAHVNEVTGDPWDGVISTMPGVTSKSIGNPSVGPVAEIGQMLPLFRPESPWEDGAVTLRTPDGKLYPFQPGSSLQTHWVNLIFAPPGSGKSVFLNMINMALCLGPGNTSLPFIHIIDIGPSSSGLISMLREALPQKRKHEVANFRLKMDSAYAINIMDLQLGMDKPLPLERAFLLNIMTVLLTPAGETKLYDAMSGLISQVIDDSYKFFAKDNAPKKYIPHVVDDIDEALSNTGYIIDNSSSWYEVRDALFDAGYHHEASLAQRYAVPTLADTVMIARLPQVQDTLADAKAPTGENIVDVYSRTIAEVQKNYPILAQATRFDLGDAKIVSIDLDEVAKGGSDAGQKQTSVMYMLARNLVSHYYLNESDVSSFPERYQPFQQARIKDIRGTKKHLCYDEFHKTSQAGKQSMAIRDQVVTDIREGRKWGVMVSLLSQVLEDFSENMIEMSTGRFVMGLGTDTAIDSLVKKFGLNASAAPILRDRLNGPTSTGANLFAILRTKQGQYSQLLTSTIGPLELWAYSTTAEDAELRNELYKRVGPKKARQLLAKRFPSGSAKDEISRRELAVEDTTVGDITKARQKVIDTLIEEII